MCVLDCNWTICICGSSVCVWVRIGYSDFFLFLNYNCFYDEIGLLAVWMTRHFILEQKMTETRKVCLFINFTWLLGVRMLARPCVFALSCLPVQVHTFPNGNSRLQVLTTNTYTSGLYNRMRAWGRRRRRWWRALCDRCNWYHVEERTRFLSRPLTLHKWKCIIFVCT